MMENVPVTEFAAAILAANAGMVNREASTKLAELVEAVMRTRKGGQVSVTIKVEPGKDSERMVKLHCSTDAKIPADKFPPSLWFLDA
jgi:chromosomal replication initiation ATPase DnaA